MTNGPTSPQHATLIAALIAAQSEIGTITKDKTAKAGAYGYTYADLPAVLEAVQPALHGNGLCITQTVTSDPDGRPHLVTTLHHTGGETIEGHYPLIIPSMDDPQKLGGAVTYARRYSILAMLNLATEDDDAQHARTPVATGTIRPTTTPMRGTPAPSLPRYPEPEEPYTNDPQTWTTPPPQRSAPPRNDGGYRGDSGEPTLTGTLSPKQFGMLMATGRKQKMDPEALDDLATAEFGKKVHELDRGEASSLIDSLLSA